MRNPTFHGSRLCLVSGLRVCNSPVVVALSDWAVTAALPRSTPLPLPLKCQRLSLHSPANAFNPIWRPHIPYHLDPTLSATISARPPSFTSTSIFSAPQSKVSASRRHKQQTCRYGLRIFLSPTAVLPVYCIPSYACSLIRATR